MGVNDCVQMDTAVSEYGAVGGETDNVVELFGSESRKVVVVDESLDSVAESSHDVFSVSTPANIISWIVENGFTLVDKESESELTGTTVFEGVVEAGEFVSGVDITFTGDSGSAAYARVDGVPVSKEGGGECGVFVLQDMTEYYEQQETLDELTELVSELEHRERELQTHVDKLDRALSAVRHDAMTPIQVVKAHLGELQTANNASAVDTIRDAIERVVSIIKDTKNLYSDEEIVENRDWCEVAELCESAWECVDTGESELCVEDEFTVWCNEDRVMRLLENMFTNAVTHNTGSVTVRVGRYMSVSTSTRQENQSGFYVADDGSGIPEERRDDVFEFGETTAADGSGIGLAVVKRVADAHEWNVRVMDSVGGGVKFAFTGVQT